MTGCASVHVSVHLIGKKGRRWGRYLSSAMIPFRYHHLRERERFERGEAQMER